MMFDNFDRLAGLAVLFLTSQLVLATPPDSGESKTVPSGSIKTATHQKTHSVIKFNSSILNEDREIWISLPEGYSNSEKKYPVLYLLDGARHFPHAQNAEQILQEESLIPQSIIVAIPNKRGMRGRDLSRQKEKFRSFIKNEVSVFVNTQYRTTDHATIFGHSMAGYFVLNVLASDPSLFDNYIAASPVIQVNNAELLTKFKTLSLPANSEQKSLYLTMTSQAQEGDATTEALNQFVSLMEQKKSDKLDWRYEYIPNQVHMTTPYITLYEGLAYVFADFQMPVYSGLQDYSDRGGFEGLKSYYETRAKKYQTTQEIPENAIRRLGLALIDDGQANEAVKLLEPIVEKSPDSIRALNALAEAYENAQPEKAIVTYKRALALAKGRSQGATNYIKTQIERLKNQSN